MLNPKLFFTEKTASLVLEAFGKKVNDEGFIVDSKGETVCTPEGEELHISKFGGLKKGSEIFIKDDLYSMMNLAEGKYNG